ncbi:hypothetical protein AMK16_07820 [Streptomyces sp. CB00455]|nr:hypothetical protein AMK16_07820 [Streptomyces sp. CB00455]
MAQAAGRGRIGRCCLLAGAPATGGPSSEGRTAPEFSPETRTGDLWRRAKKADEEHVSPARWRQRRRAPLGRPGLPPG